MSLPVNANMLRSLILPASGLTGFLLFTACSPVQQLQSVATGAGALANSVTGSNAPVALSAVELRQLQTRDFTATKAAAFSSVITVLLDSGYRILSADLESGLVTASAPSTGRLRLDPTGVGRATQTPVASAFVEDRGSGTVRVRITFSVSRSATGLGSSGENPVLDQGVYDAFFTRLEEEVQLRPAPGAAAPAAQPLSATHSAPAEPVPHTEIAAEVEEVEEAVVEEVEDDSDQEMVEVEEPASVEQP